MGFPTMSLGQIVAWLVAAVLLFWAVGAHNRLVGLRNALVRAFAPVEQQFQQRQALLRRLAEVLSPAAAEGEAAATEEPAVAQLRAALAQADAACVRARARPGANGALSSLRLAEDILEQARGRLGDRLAAPACAEVLAELAQADAALGFARRQYNEAVQAYNAAVQQFPTWVIAGLLRFRRAGTL